MKEREGCGEFFHLPLGLSFSDETGQQTGPR